VIVDREVGGRDLQRFVLRQNIARFQKLLGQETEHSASWHTLQTLLLSAQRELAVLNAALSGVGTEFLPPGPHVRAAEAPHLAQRFLREFERSPHPYLILDPRPGFRIVDINDAYARVTMTARGRVVGEPYFDVFPDNPDDWSADGVSKLYDSIRSAVEAGSPHALDIQRYDVRDAEGHFVERYWRTVNTPIFDMEGRLVYVLDHVEDVTRDVLAPRGQPAPDFIRWERRHLKLPVRCCRRAREFGDRAGAWSAPCPIEITAR